MDAFDKLIAKVKAINPIEVVRRAVMSEAGQTEVLETQRKEWDSGVNADGEVRMNPRTGRPYSDYWEFERRKMGLPVDRVTLNFWGRMASEIKVQDLGNGFIVAPLTSHTQEKFDQNEEYYGEEFMEISENGKEELSLSLGILMSEELSHVFD